MNVTYKDLNTALEALKTACQSDKQGLTNMLMLANKEAGTLVLCCGPTPSYKIAYKVDVEYDELDYSAELVLNIKRFSELVSIAKPTTSLITEISLQIDQNASELIFGLKKCLKIDENNIRPISKISQRMGYFTLDSNKYRGIDKGNVDTMFAVGENSATWPRDNVVSILNKLSSGNTPQILFSEKNKAVAACNTNFAVYMSNEYSGFSGAVLTSTAKSIVTVVKNAKQNQIAFVKGEENTLYISDGTFALQTALPLAKQLLLSQVNGFNSVEYPKFQAVFKQNALLDFMKSFKSITGTDKAVIKFENVDNVWYLLLNVQGAKDRFNECSISVESINGETDDLSPYSIMLDTFISMLNICDSDTIRLSLSAKTEDSPRLLRINTENENMTICYSVEAD